MSRLKPACLAALVLGLAAHARAQVTPQAELTPHQRLAREVYSELISINTVDSVGSVTKAAEAMAKRFRDAGFPDSDVKVLVPEGKPTKGNLVVRYRSRGGAGAAKRLPVPGELGYRSRPGSRADRPLVWAALAGGGHLPRGA